jgi:organic radical activating enzyme
LQCDGFGQDDPTNPDTYELPYKNFNVLDVKDITDLPVWEKGCDSSYSWSKKFKHLQKNQTAEGIVETLRQKMISEFNPKGDFTNPISGASTHLVYTGGESLMKHAQEAAIEINTVYKSKLGHERPWHITWETNGTQPLTDNFIRTFGNRGQYSGEFFFSCSPKLFTVSGEKPKKAIRPDVVSQYNDLGNVVRHRSTDSRAPVGQLKFVLGPKPEQWEELDEVVHQFREAGVDWPVWIMPCGAREEDQRDIAGDIANMAQVRGYYVSARVHCYLWGNEIGV